MAENKRDWTSLTLKLAGAWHIAYQWPHNQVNNRKLEWDYNSLEIGRFRFDTPLSFCACDVIINQYMGRNDLIRLEFYNVDIWGVRTISQVHIQPNIICKPLQCLQRVSSFSFCSLVSFMETLKHCTN